MEDRRIVVRLLADAWDSSPKPTERLWGQPGLQNKERGLFLGWQILRG